jgi:hypothetical protein
MTPSDNSVMIFFQVRCIWSPQTDEDVAWSLKVLKPREQPMIWINSHTKKILTAAVPLPWELSDHRSGARQAGDSANHPDLGDR